MPIRHLSSSSFLIRAVIGINRAVPVLMPSRGIVLTGSPEAFKVGGGAAVAQFVFGDWLCAGRGRPRLGWSAGLCSACAGARDEPEAARSGGEAVPGTVVAAPVHVADRRSPAAVAGHPGAVRAGLRWRRWSAGRNISSAASCLSPVPSAASDVASYLIVDGQQRLTTLMLILAAIRDAAAKTDAQAIERYDELYLINKFQTGQARFRLLPTQADRPSFSACITRDAAAGGQDPIGQAYRFFRSHVELPGPDEEPLDLDRLTAVVVERLAVVDITTGQGDNAHRIFQSLNATGVNLTQADLLRNLIFMLLPTRAGRSTTRSGGRWNG